MSDEQEFRHVYGDMSRFDGAPPIFRDPPTDISPIEVADAPLSPVFDGDRDPETGRFVAGNSCARGNPNAQRASEIRAELFGACEPGEVRQIVRKVIDEAKEGRQWAIRILLDRLLGPPISLDVAARIEKLEILLEGKLQ